MNRKRSNFFTLSFTLGAALLSMSFGAAADNGNSTDASRHAGRASVYQNLDDTSLEEVTDPALIESIARAPANYAPTEIWRALEHGEKVECLDCIPYVRGLLFDDHAKTREIAAWWLRRRIFGVFGPGEAYSQTLQTLQNANESDVRRAYAAEALGEFLTSSGIAPLANALTRDPSARVRKSSALALQRLNSQGPNGELATALSDADEDVKMAALQASIGVNVFTGVDKVLALIGDPSARVRRRAADNLGVLHARDAVVGLVALTQPKNEPDASVRAAAVAALGRIGDPASKNAVQAALADSDSFVKDAAQIALRRL